MAALALSLVASPYPLFDFILLRVSTLGALILLEGQYKENVALIGLQRTYTLCHKLTELPWDIDPPLTTVVP